MAEIILVRVVAPHFVAGFDVADGKVKRAAPIIQYMNGWSAEKARAYIKKKGWDARIIPVKKP
jgi:hypothetical protein